MIKVKNKTILTIILIITVFITMSCSINNKDKENISYNNGIKYNSKIINNKMHIFLNNEWSSMNVKSITFNYNRPYGVDRFDIKDFENEIEKIDKMNANTILLNDLMPSDFYRALKNYNKKSKYPIYIIQKIPMEIKTFNKSLDPFNLDNFVPFEEKIKLIIDSLHGNANITNKNGKYINQRGYYDTDVSNYVLSWIIGNKWSPEIINYTNENRTDKVDYNGNYLSIAKSNPFEVFLTEILDNLIDYEVDTYNWHRPVSFLSSQRTDILSHKYEPDNINSISVINPNNIKTQNENISFFVSYDITPYYPEYMNLDPKYIKYIDSRGKTNSFAGYINDLYNEHKVPIFISKFGLPSSRGIKRISTSNFNKGKHDEREQGTLISNMYEDIINEKLLGGSINSWFDNWSKKVKITKNRNNNKWLDVENPNENFGLNKWINNTNNIYIDGDKKDWKKIKPLYSNSKKKNNSSIYNNIYAYSDRAYLYLAIEYNDIYDNFNSLIFINTDNSHGSNKNPYIKNIKTSQKNNFILNISNVLESKILVHSYYDYIYYYNSYISNTLEPVDKYNDKFNNHFNPIRTIIKSGVNHDLISYIDFESGKLIKGNTNPELDDFNSISDYNIKDNFIEIRIPWRLLNFVDPVEPKILDDFRGNDKIKAKKINNINLSFLTYNLDNKKQFNTIPLCKDGIINGSLKYNLDKQDNLQLELIEKQSYFIIQNTFQNY